LQVVDQGLLAQVVFSQTKEIKMAASISFLSSQSVYANLQVLAKLQTGQKITIEHETGRMSVHVPYRGETLGRWWGGAFNPDKVQATFERAVQIMDLKEENEADEKVYGRMDVLVSEALKGIKMLRNTYKKEGKYEMVNGLIRVRKEIKARIKEFQAVSLAESLESQDSSTSSTLSLHPSLETKKRGINKDPLFLIEEETHHSESENSASVSDPGTSVELVDREHVIVDVEAPRKVANKTSKISLKKLFCCIK
jgi:hypothetical protein